MPVARFPRDVRAPRDPELETCRRNGEEEELDMPEEPERIAPRELVPEGRITRRALLVQGAAAREEPVTPRLERAAERDLACVEDAEALRRNVPGDVEREIPPEGILLTAAPSVRPLWRGATELRR